MSTWSELRAALQTEIARRGHGARADLARFCGLRPQHLTPFLNGREPRWSVGEQMRAWMEQPQETAGGASILQG